MTDREYRTDDVGEAAYLLLQGVALLRTTLAGGRRAVFVWNDSLGEATYHSHIYFEGQPVVNARAFVASERAIRRAMYDAMDGRAA